MDRRPTIIYPIWRSAQSNTFAPQRQREDFARQDPTNRSKWDAVGERENVYASKKRIQICKSTKKGSGTDATHIHAAKWWEDQSDWKSITKTAIPRWESAIATLPPAECQMGSRKGPGDLSTSEQWSPSYIVDPSYSRQHSNQLHDTNTTRDHQGYSVTSQSYLLHKGRTVIQEGIDTWPFCKDRLEMKIW